jgi:aryl carrier-like protein
MNQNFFDAGGDSLRLIQVRAALREQLGVEIPVADLFRYPTIFDLARHLSETEDEPEDVRTEADERAARRRSARARRAAVR